MLQLDGRRVRVILALKDRDVMLESDEQARVWPEWVQGGPQGPIEYDGEPEFP